MASPADYNIKGMAKGEDLRIENGVFYRVSTGKPVETLRTTDWLSNARLNEEWTIYKPDGRGHHRYIMTSFFHASQTSEKTVDFINELISPLKDGEITEMVDGLEMQVNALREELAARGEVKNEEGNLYNQAKRDIEGEKKTIMEAAEKKVDERVKEEFEIKRKAKIAEKRQDRKIKREKMKLKREE